MMLLSNDFDRIITSLFLEYFYLCDSSVIFVSKKRYL